MNVDIQTMTPRELIIDDQRCMEEEIRGNICRIIEALEARQEDLITQLREVTQRKLQTLDTDKYVRNRVVFANNCTELIEACKVWKVYNPELHLENCAVTRPKKVRIGEKFVVSVDVLDQEGKMYQQQVHMYGEMKFSDRLTGKDDSESEEGKCELEYQLDFEGDHTLTISATDVAGTLLSKCEYTIEACDYSEQLKAVFIQGDSAIPDVYKLSDEDITDECPPDTKKYTYLHFDSARLSELTPEQNNEQFRKFVDAIFYVGKGTHREDRTRDGQRSHDHLRPGTLAVNAHIRSMFKSGKKVTILELFKNKTDPEAQTREACMIEAIGVNMLTNAKRGTVKGDWSREKQQWVGVYLLFQAYHLYMEIR